MTIRLLVSLLGFQLAAMAVPISPGEFFKNYAGHYKIELHGGVKPHGNSVAKIEDFGNAGFMEMGYCPDGSGFCDIGYLDFPLSSTRIEQINISQTQTLFKIELDLEGSQLRYEFEVDGKTARFSNFQYVFESGKVGVLVHELIRLGLNEDEPPVVNVQEFFKARLGNYKIELHGGVEPHTNSIGTVEELADQALVTLGYCDESLGFCDIGYREMPYSGTAVKLLSQSDTTQVFGIEARIGEELFRYQWEQNGKKIIFKTFDYRLPDGKILPVLEHVLTAVNEHLP